MSRQQGDFSVICAANWGEQDGVIHCSREVYEQPKKELIEDPCGGFSREPVFPLELGLKNKGYSDESSSQKQLVKEIRGKFFLF